eukprot:CAMPEP_0181218306 /NCGR_PEP_ID=MMETSP1096-20121128/27627_1 /TAXON_ID=156174 ORGANISM="Chrysochromulina ericina, Strain CCMP281" /NCGR_SAMPLE_ID=MMETSP1096 /ASSEMBLY_ACC=CAM_ASM_000453 /LENGTH=133 /DNA_ID=CAMNT_0023310521 /DNA_START=48 /DNA_END=450 /DNA_ORIENTATION=+
MKENPYIRKLKQEDRRRRRHNAVCSMGQCSMVEKDATAQQHNLWFRGHREPPAPSSNPPSATIWNAQEVGTRVKLNPLKGVVSVLPLVVAGALDNPSATPAPPLREAGNMGGVCCSTLYCMSAGTSLLFIQNP